MFGDAPDLGELMSSLRIRIPELCMWLGDADVWQPMTGSAPVLRH